MIKRHFEEKYLNFLKISDELKDYHLQDLLFSKMSQEDKFQFILSVHGFDDEFDFRETIKNHPKDFRLKGLSDKEIPDFWYQKENFNQWVKKNYNKEMAKLILSNDELRYDLGLTGDETESEVLSVYELNFGKGKLDFKESLFKEIFFSQAFNYNINKKIEKKCSDFSKKLIESLPYKRFLIFKPNRPKKLKDLVGTYSSRSSVYLLQGVDLYNLYEKSISLPINTYYISDKVQYVPFEVNEDPLESLMKHLTKDLSYHRATIQKHENIFKRSQTLKRSLCQKVEFPRAIYFIDMKNIEERITAEKYSFLLTLFGKMKSMGVVCILNCDVDKSVTNDRNRNLLRNNTFHKYTDGIILPKGFL